MIKKEHDIAFSIIAKCGGVKTVARWCHVAPKSVYKWRTKGIPTWHHQKILLNAIGAGIDLLPNDFFFVRS